MELDFAILAEAATSSGDGKMNMLGCGYDIYVAPVIPFIVARMTMALRFLVRPAEANQPHRYEIRLIDGDGNGVLVPYCGNIQTRKGRLSGAIIPCPLILELGPVTFTRHGPYSFEILIEKHVAKSLPLYVVRSLTGR